MKQTPENLEKQAIKQYLSLIGAFHFYLLQGMGAYKGAPDLMICFRGIVYALEVKTKKGRQSDWQKKFQQDWENAGGIYLLGGLDEVLKVIKLK